MVIYNSYAICGFAALGGMLFGFDISSMSGVLGTQAYTNYFCAGTRGDGTIQGAITASMPAGSLVGALLSSFIADRLSRRAAIQVGGLIFIIGAILQCSAQNIGHLCVGRVIAGIAIGICSSIVPVYQSEIAPKEALRFEREQSVSSFKALVEPRMFKRVILGMSIQMWSQLCGMNIMMYYIVYIMEGAGIADALTTASIQYVINVVLTLPAILYLDRFGRRPALLLGSFGMMIWLFINGALQGAYGQPQDKQGSEVTWVIGPQHRSVSKAVVAFSYLFVATFATTWGPVSWTYPSEIFPSKIRAKAVSLATSSNWAWNTALAFAVPPLLKSINWKMYMIFGTFNGLALIHMFLTAPETKGRTLEEMDEVFDSGIPAWRSRAPEVSRLERLQRDIEAGTHKVDVSGDGKATTVTEEPKMG